MKVLLKKSNINTNQLIAISIFYLTAIILRYLSNKTPLLENINSSFLQIILQGVGPAIGALIGWKILSQKPNYSIAGKLRPLLLSLFVFVVIPVVGFALVGMKESKTISITSNPLIAGAKLSLYIIIYSIFEEIGWRVFLQEQLKSINKYLSIFIIAVLWFTWHLNFALTISNLIFFLLLLFASWGIGSIGNHTKSILAVGAFHAFYNLYGMDNFPEEKKYIVLGISIVIGGVYILSYDKLRLKFKSISS